MGQDRLGPLTSHRDGFGADGGRASRTIAKALPPFACVHLGHRRDLAAGAAAAGVAAASTPRHAASTPLRSPASAYGKQVRLLPLWTWTRMAKASNVRSLRAASSTHVHLPTCFVDDAARLVTPRETCMDGKFPSHCLLLQTVITAT